MSLDYFLDKSITLRRLHRVDANRSVFSATGTAWLSSFQDRTPGTDQVSQGQFAIVYDCYVPIECPISETWQVVRDGKTYAVRGVKTIDFGSTQFKRVILTEGIV